MIEQQVAGILDAGPFDQEGRQRGARQADARQTVVGRPQPPAGGPIGQVSRLQTAMFEKVQQNVQVLFGFDKMFGDALRTTERRIGTLLSQFAHGRVQTTDGGVVYLGVDRLDLAVIARFGGPKLLVVVIGENSQISVQP